MRWPPVFLAAFGCHRCHAGILHDFAEKVSRGDLEGLLTSFNASGDASGDQPNQEGHHLSRSLRDMVTNLLPRILRPCLTSPVMADAAQVALQEHMEEGHRRVVQLAELMTGSPLPAPFTAVLAAVAARTRREGSLAPECRMLRSVIPEGACSVIVNVGMMCLWALLQAAARAEDFDEWAFGPGDQISKDLWRFHSNLGSPVETLAYLLTQREATSFRMVEIGVWKGDLCTELLERFPSLEMLLVDPYHLRIPGVAVDQEQGLSSETLDMATTRTQRYRSRATHMLQVSPEAAHWVARSSLDAIYVDGDHSYEGVAADLSSWWPTLKPGGFLAGHDYTLIWPGVVVAVNEFAQAHQLAVHFTDEIWWAAQNHLRDLTKARSDEGEPFSLEDLEESFQGATEVSYHQEVLLETSEDEAVLVQAAHSGYGLGGSLWTVECHGLRVTAGAVAGTADVKALTTADALVLLGGLANVEGKAMDGQLSVAAKQVSSVLATGGSVLVPTDFHLQAFLGEMTELFARAVPILALGSAAAFLRRCGRFSEWATPNRQERAWRGEHPFLIAPLLQSGRVILAETLNGMASHEQVVVVAPWTLTKHFENLWATKDGSSGPSRRLETGRSRARGQLQGIGEPMMVPRMTASELVKHLTLAKNSVKLLLRTLPTDAVSTTLATCEALEVLVAAEPTEVALDLTRPRVPCWLPRELVVSARQQGTSRKRPTDVLPFHGTFIGRTRPRLALRTAEGPELLAGQVEVQAFREAMKKVGLPVAGSGEIFEVPALQARIQLNQPIHGTLETIVECKSADGRRRIAEVLDSLLMAL
eukprot:symbB.v1.2.012969.t1/scaffold908.1/size153097/2